MKLQHLLLSTRVLEYSAFGLACLLFFSVWAVAQTGTATLSGTVKDTTGAIIPGVKIQVRNNDTNISIITATNGVGVYVVSALKPGGYRIVADKTGFKHEEINNLRLNVGDALNQDLTMQVGTISESVTVVAEPEHVNATDATVGTVVERRVVEDMPLNGRSFQGLITLTPGVATVAAGNNTPGQFVVNGQRTDTSYFTVDGVSANAGAPISGSINTAGTGATPTTTVSGGYNNMVSIDALQEFKISTSSFAPEFGRTPGGQISMVSRNGTNAVRGDVFEYLRNTVLDANDWFLNATGKPRGIVQQNDFGGVVGGPVIKDKLFFFVSYEGLRLNSPNPSVKVVPTQAARTLAANTTDNGIPGYMAQFLNAYPLPDGNPSTACTSSASCFANFTGSFPGRTVLDATSVRMDYALSGHMTLFGRYSHSPNSSNVDNSVYARALTGGNDVYTAGLTSVISNRMNNDLRFNFTHTTFVGGYDPLNFKGTLSTIFPSGYAQPPSQYSLAQMTLQFGTGIANFDTLIWGPDSSNNGNDQINITETWGWTRGHHELKFGGDWRQLTPSYHQSDFNWNNQFALTIGSSPNYCPGGTVPGYICGIANLSNIQHNIPQHFRFENYSFFGQDTWKIEPRLTITYGLRWEINPAVAWTSDNPGFSVNRSTFNLANLMALTLNTLGTPAYPTRWGNVSPRFGIAHQLSTNPKWGRVIRAGYGLFYDTGQQVFALASNPWSARYNNQGPPIVPVQFPISTANAVYVTPPIIPNPPSFPLYLQTDDLIDPNFKLPYVHEFNFTVEQQLGPSQSFTASYVGALGRRLIGTAEYPPNKTNPNVLGNGTVGDTIYMFGNYATSSYHALQTKFQRQFSHGFAAIASYTWSHSIDTGSVNANIPTQAVPTAAILASAIPFNLVKAPSDFDIRQAFGLSLVYDIPTPFRGNRFAGAVLGHWSVDPIYHYQTAVPVDVFANTSSSLGGATGLGQRPNLISGVPIYVYGADCAAQHNGQGCPGGVGFNIAPVTAAVAAANGCVAPTATNAKGAFCTPLPIGGQAVSGNLGRNALRGFALQEFDLSVHRNFRLTERFRLRFQSDMFNLFNHPQFGPQGGLMSGATFGVATAMANSNLGAAVNSGAGYNPIFNTGGPRNFQFAMKLFF